MMLMLPIFWAAVLQVGPAPSQATRPPQVTVVTATGIGRPPRHMHGAHARLMARRAAEVNALRNLQVKLGKGPSGSTGPFRYVATRFLRGGVVEVTVEAKVSRGG